MIRTTLTRNGKADTASGSSKSDGEHGSHILGGG